MKELKDHAPRQSAALAGAPRAGCEEAEPESLRLPLSVLAQLPPYDGPAVQAKYREAVSSFAGKIVVLDDDPTGVQTVHGLFVYTDWSLDTLREAFAGADKMFYILTNSRGLSAQESESLHQQLGKNLAAVSRETGQAFLLISRGDSTLRGHYPLETETLKNCLEAELSITYDGEILMPFFLEGGRYTLGNIHYVAMGEELVPVGLTEFARDKTFGFHASSLPAWIEERTAGRYPSGSVCCVTLEQLRNLEYEKITEMLCAVQDFGKVVVNAADQNDGAVFVTALIEALARGKRFLFRTAAALPKLLGGVADRPLLSREELVPAGAKRGGLVIVGSHVSKTTKQLEHLLKLPGLCELEFDQHLILQPELLEIETRRVIAAASEAIEAGTTAVIYTRRERLDVGSGSKEDELALAVKISGAVTSIVQRLQTRPAWVIAKGGITSSEIGVTGLGVRKARILGQVLAGVPVWETGPESKFPGLAYVVFPGNVGSETALYELVRALRG